MAPDTFRFPSSHRLTRKADLTAVLRGGKRVRTKFLSVRALASPLPHPRVGIVVPKRQRTTADRNRLKRRMREVIRIHVLPYLGSVDVVIQAHREAYEASFLELRGELIVGIQHAASGLKAK